MSKNLHYFNNLLTLVLIVWLIRIFLIAVMISFLDIAQETLNFGLAEKSKLLVNKCDGRGFTNIIFTQVSFLLAPKTIFPLEKKN